MIDDLIFEKPPIVKCVVCGNEYASKEKDANFVWKLPPEIEIVQYNGKDQFRCIPKLHEDVTYAPINSFGPIPTPEPSDM